MWFQNSDLTDSGILKLTTRPTGPRTIEVCSAGRCKWLHAPRPAAAALSYLRLVNGLSDGHTLVLGYGITRTAERLEFHDLDKPNAPPRFLPIPKRQCAAVLDELRGNLLVQMSDCANASGERLLMTRAGIRVASLGIQAHDAPYLWLRGDRWLFESYPGGLAIWDVAKGRRLATDPLPPDKVTLHPAVIDGVLVKLDGEGKLSATTPR